MNSLDSIKQSKKREIRGSKKIVRSERQKERKKVLEVGEFKVSETFSHHDPICNCAYMDWLLFQFLFRFLGDGPSIIDFRYQKIQSKFIDNPRTILFCKFSTQSNTKL